MTANGGPRSPPCCVLARPNTGKYSAFATPCLAAPGSRHFLANVPGRTTRLALFRRRGRGAARRAATTPVDFLIVGLGNPGAKHAGTRHNIGFEVASALADRWQLPKARKRFLGLVTQGRTGPGGPRVAVLLPQTYMNEAGRSVGPAAGAFKVPPECVVVIHDEIDLPFGEVRTRLGGGLAGHNGLKSVRQYLGTADFQRVRVGVGRPESTDPEIVAGYVLSRFGEPIEDVRGFVARAVEVAEQSLLKQGL